MTAGRLLLVRHGRTAYNSEARLQGQVDIPLDAVGRWQARTAAARLLTRHEPTAIVVSDLSRAPRDGAASWPGPPVSTSRSTPGCASGRSALWEGLTGDDLRRDWADEFAVWRAGGQPEGVGAETRAEVAAARARGDPRARRRARSATTPWSSSRTAPPSAAPSATCSACRPTGTASPACSTPTGPSSWPPAATSRRRGGWSGTTSGPPTRRRTGTPDRTPRATPTPTPRRGTPTDAYRPGSFAFACSSVSSRWFGGRVWPPTASTTSAQPSGA